MISLTGMLRSGARLPVLPALLFTLTLWGGEVAHAQMHGKAHDMGGSMAQGEPAAAPSGHSVYLLDSVWQDDRGADVPIGSLAGRPVVLAMVYTSCEHACPVIVEDMKRIEQALPADMKAGVSFVLVSFDPERDSPAALAKYRAQRHLPREGWRLLTGTPDTVLELAVVLGVQVRPDGFGGFAHSNLITVLDAEGVVRHRQVGLRAEPAGTLEALHGLLGG